MNVAKIAELVNRSPREVEMLLHLRQQPPTTIEQAKEVLERGFITEAMKQEAEAVIRRIHTDRILATKTFALALQAAKEGAESGTGRTAAEHMFGLAKELTEVEQIIKFLDNRRIGIQDHDIEGKALRQKVMVLLVEKAEDFDSLLNIRKNYKNNLDKTCVEVRDLLVDKTRPMVETLALAGRPALIELFKTLGGWQPFAGEIATKLIGLTDDLLGFRELLGLVANNTSFNDQRHEILNKIKELEWESVKDLTVEEALLAALPAITSDMVKRHIHGKLEEIWGAIAANEQASIDELIAWYRRVLPDYKRHAFLRLLRSVKTVEQAEAVCELVEYGHTQELQRREVFQRLFDLTHGFDERLALLERVPGEMKGTIRATLLAAATSFEQVMRVMRPAYGGVDGDLYKETVAKAAGLAGTFNQAMTLFAESNNKKDKEEGVRLIALRALLPFIDADKTTLLASLFSRDAEMSGEERFLIITRLAEIPEPEEAAAVA